MIFDIETKPLASERIKEILPPFDAAKELGPHPADRDPLSNIVIESSMRLDDMQAMVADAHEQHASEIEAYQRAAAEAEHRYWMEAFERAALAAETASVCAIGYYSAWGYRWKALDGVIDENLIIRGFWDTFEDCRKSGERMIGFNIHRFDVPFLIRRSWYLGIDVPPGVWSPMTNISAVFFDLLVRWQCGNRDQFVSLDRVCRAMGVKGKPSDCTGADFHRLLANPSTRQVAIEYLRNDLRMTADLAERMGINHN